MAQTVTIVLSDDDIIDYQISREHWEPVEFLRTRGFTAGATTASNMPVFSKWPGSSPGFGNEDSTEDKLITDSVQDNYNRNGRRGARKNRIYVDSDGVWRKAPTVELTLFGAYDVIDPANAEWIEFDVGAVTNLRGTALSDFRWIARRVSVSYEGGTARTRLTLDAETHGEAGVDDTPLPETSTGFDPGTWTPPDWAFPPPIGVLPPIDIPPGGLVPGLKRLALVMSDGHLRRTTNFEHSSPSYDDTDLSGVVGTSVLQWCYDARSNSASTGGWLLTPGALFYLSNIWRTPTATLVATLSSTSIWRDIDSSYTLDTGKFIVVTGRYANGVHINVSLDGAMFGPDVSVGGADPAVGGVPPIRISTLVRGRAWVGAWDGATSDEHLYRSDDYASTFTKLTVLYDDDGYGAGMVLPPLDESVMYFGYSNYNEPAEILYNANGVMRGALPNAGMAEISPIVGGVRYGVDKTRARFTLSVAPNNKERLLVCGADHPLTPTNRGVFLITNAGSAANAGAVTMSTLVSPGASVPYTRGALVDNVTAYLFGLNGAIAYCADGVTVSDRKGNISTTAEVVGIVG